MRGAWDSKLVCMNLRPKISKMWQPDLPMFFFTYYSPHNLGNLEESILLTESFIDTFPSVINEGPVDALDRCDGVLPAH